MAVTYWFSCPKFTGRVDVNEQGTIVLAMPFCRKFVGQPLSNLVGWAQKRFGAVETVEISKE